VVVSNGCNTVTSSVAAVTNNTAVSIITQPAAVITCAGTSASFSVDAIGTNLTYQWYKGTTLIPGATNSILTLSNVQSSDAANYSVVVTGACNNVTSSTVSLTVNTPIAITAQPISQTICSPSVATLSVTVSGTNATYQWYQDGISITGATSNTYTTTTTGNYYVVVSNSCNGVTSNNTLVTTNAATAIASQPASIEVCVGTAASFSVAATGTNLTYQWFRNGAILNGATSSSLTISNTRSQNNGAVYTVVVSDPNLVISGKGVPAGMNDVNAFAVFVKRLLLCVNSVVLVSFVSDFIGGVKFLV
jgi:hypothetical protein